MNDYDDYVNIEVSDLQNYFLVDLLTQLEVDELTIKEMKMSEKKDFYTTTKEWVMHGAAKEHALSQLACEANAMTKPEFVEPEVNMFTHAYKLNSLTYMLKMNCEPVNVHAVAKLLCEIDAELALLKQKIVKFF